jgi:hypothetical protein
MTNPEAVQKLVDAFNSNEFQELGTVLEEYADQEVRAFKEKVIQRIEEREKEEINIHILQGMNIVENIIDEL